MVWGGGGIGARKWMRGAELTSAIETQAHYHAGWVYVVSPEELERQVDLGWVCVGVGVGAEGFDRRVPDAVWSFNGFG